MVEPLRPANDEDLLMRPLVPMPQIAEPENENPYADVETDFDPDFREPFIGMLHLGSLTQTESLWGHTFKIQTPGQRERLEAGMLHKPYINSIAAETAWATITVAMYLRKVDDVDLPNAIDPRGTGVEDRFNWVLDNVKPEVISRLFERCLLLDAEVAGTLKELEKQGKE